MTTMTILTRTGVSINFSDLTEDEYARLMDLCFDIGLRQGIEAGMFEEKDGTIHLKTKGGEKP
jgi:hypothetical protein